MGGWVDTECFGIFEKVYVFREYCGDRRDGGDLDVCSLCVFL